MPKNKYVFTVTMTVTVWETDENEARDLLADEIQTHFAATLDGEPRLIEREEK